MQRRIVFILPLLAFSLAPAVLAAAGQTSPSRYLYVLGCAATVDKLDTSEDKKLDTVDLPSLTRRVFPDAKGTLNGCLAYQTVADPKKAVFYTIVPVQADAKADGTKDYRLASFAIPKIRFVDSRPAGSNLDDPPYLSLGPEGEPRVLLDSERPLETTLDATHFPANTGRVPNRILETSGDGVLLNIFTANQEQFVLAVLHRRTKQLVRLQDIPLTRADSVHLAPGGSAVLLEEMTWQNGEMTKTETLRLYDAGTGKELQNFTDPQIQKLYFLAITPSGKAVYRSNDTYRFFNLGRTFANDFVSSVAKLNGPFGVMGPEMFYFDR